MASCPHCRRPLDSPPHIPGLILDGSELIIASQTHTIRLSLNEFTVVKLLHDHFNAYVPMQRVAARLYGAYGEHPRSNVVQALVSKIRRKIAPLNLSIQAYSRMGYKLYRPLENA